MDDRVEELDAVEQRVVEKWATVAAVRRPDGPVLDDNPLDLIDWLTEPIPPDVPQFPREQWVSYPAKRRVALMQCEGLLDSPDEITDEQWTLLCLMMLYGGKTSPS